MASRLTPKQRTFLNRILSLGLRIEFNEISLDSMEEEFRQIQGLLDDCRIELIMAIRMLRLKKEGK